MLMIVLRHVADHRKIMERDCMEFFCKMEEMVFLEPLTTGDRQHDNKDEIRDQKNKLDL